MSSFVGRVVPLSGVSGVFLEFSDLWSVFVNCCSVFERFSHQGRAATVLWKTSTGIVWIQQAEKFSIR